MTEIRGRVQALDRLRGLIVVLMALDHANYFVAQAHSSGEYWGGSFPVYPTVWAFLTRLVTHLTAPGFFFLMGVGMVLFSLKRDEEGWNKTEIRRHFLLRGALLILLQLLVVNRAWELSPRPLLRLLLIPGGTEVSPQPDLSPSDHGSESYCTPAVLFHRRER